MPAEGDKGEVETEGNESVGENGDETGKIEKQGIAGK